MYVISTAARRALIKTRIFQIARALVKPATVALRKLSYIAAIGARIAAMKRDYIARKSSSVAAVHHAPYQKKTA